MSGARTALQDFFFFLGGGGAQGPGQGLGVWGLGLLFRVYDTRPKETLHPSIERMSLLVALSHDADAGQHLTTSLGSRCCDEKLSPSLESLST